jgi:hypothetical protein
MPFIRALIGFSSPAAVLVVAAAGCGGIAVDNKDGGSGGTRGTGTGSTGTGGSDGSGGTSGAGGTSGSGGTTGTGLGGSGGTTGFPGDGGGPPDASEPCPTAEPLTGQSCAPSGLWCEYGSNPAPYCNDLWECSAGAWQNHTEKGACPPVPTPCPPSYRFASRSKGRCASSIEGQGALCEYPEGVCLCTDDPGGLPIENGPVWSCTPTTRGCPPTVPKLGTACTADPTTVCDYGECSGGVGLQCVDGYWAIAMTVCPA